MGVGLLGCWLLVKFEECSRSVRTAFGFADPNLAFRDSADALPAPDFLSLKPSVSCLQPSAASNAVRTMFEQCSGSVPLLHPSWSPPSRAERSASVKAAPHRALNSSRFIWIFQVRLSFMLSPRSPQPLGRNPGRGKRKGGCGVGKRTKPVSTLTSQHDRF